MSDESSWAWVSVIVSNYRQWETRTVRAGISAGKVAYAEAQHAVAATADAARHGQQVAEAAFVSAVDSSLSATYHASQAYPEVSVAALTLASCRARGSANGTWLGNAPRRAALTALIFSSMFSTPLAQRWGESVAAASKQLSDSLKTQAQAAGLLA